MADVARDVLVRLAALEQALEGLRGRLDQLECAASAVSPGPRPVRASTLPAEAGEVEAPTPPVVASTGGESVVSLAGTLLLALAGAYLVRALTDGGTLSATSGVVLGLAYALAFAPLAARAAADGRPLSATTHGVTSALIAYPLLWETTVRFGLLSPLVGLALLVCVLGGALLLARRYLLAPVAIVHTLFALGSTLGLLVATHELTAAGAALLAQAALVELLVRRPAWALLRWLAAAAVDLGLLAMVMVMGRPEGLPEGYPGLSASQAVALVLALPSLYLLRVAGGTLRTRRSVTAFETLQLTLAMLLGFEGAAHLLSARGGSPVALGLVALALGLAGYALAFMFVERRQGRGLNFYVYSTSGGLLLGLGSLHVCAPTERVLAWSALGVALAWLGGRFDRSTLRYHALAYLLAAGFAGGLWSLAGAGVFGRSAVEIPPTAVATLVAAWLTYVVLARGGDPGGRLVRGLSALLACVAVPGIVGALAGRAGADAILMMGARTTVLAALAVALAAGCRRGARPELGGLAHLVLAVGALKLLVQDVPAGHAGELFASFLLLGGALVLTSRLLAGDR